MDFNYSVFSDEHPKVAEALKEIEEAIEEFRIGLCDDFYRELETEYTYRQSEESVKETCDANEYLFDIQGTLR
jgi:hypothetical protein